MEKFQLIRSGLVVYSAIIVLAIATLVYMNIGGFQIYAYASGSLVNICGTSPASGNWSQHDASVCGGCSSSGTCAGPVVRVYRCNKGQELSGIECRANEQNVGGSVSFESAFNNPCQLIQIDVFGDNSYDQLKDFVVFKGANFDNQNGCNPTTPPVTTPPITIPVTTPPVTTPPACPSTQARFRLVTKSGGDLGWFHDGHTVYRDDIITLQYAVFVNGDVLQHFNGQIILTHYDIHEGTTDGAPRDILQIANTKYTLEARSGASLCGLAEVTILPPIVTDTPPITTPPVTTPPVTTPPVTTPPVTTPPVTTVPPTVTPTPRVTIPVTDL